jgi:methyl-accepting chemotaxis protein
MSMFGSVFGGNGKTEWTEGTEGKEGEAKGDEYGLKLLLEDWQKAFDEAKTTVEEVAKDVSTKTTELVESAKHSYEETKENVEHIIADAKETIESAKQSLEEAKENARLAIIEAKHKYDETKANVEQALSDAQQWTIATTQPVMDWMQNNLNVSTPRP